MPLSQNRHLNHSLKINFSIDYFNQQLPARKSFTILFMMCITF